MDDLNLARSALEQSARTGGDQIAYTGVFSNPTPAYPDGRAMLSLALANHSSRFEAQLRSMTLDVERRDDSDLKPIYAQYRAMGGSGIDYQFRADIGFGAGARDWTARRTIRVKPLPGETFDYVSIKTQEAEGVMIELLFRDAGQYTITPTLTITYGSDTFLETLKPVTLVVPRRYQAWRLKDRALVPSPAVVSFAGDLDWVGPLPMPADPPVLFEANLVDHFNTHLMLLDGDIISLLDSDPRPAASSAMHKARWSEDGTRITFDECVDKQPTRRVLDLATQRVLTETVALPCSPTVPLALKRKLDTSYGVEYRDLVKTLNGDRLALASPYVYAPVRREAQIIVVSSKTGDFAAIDADTWCGHPAWSPSGRRLAYVCTATPTGDADAPTHLWVVQPGESPVRLSQQSGLFWYPSWSKDETKLLVGGDGLRVFTLDSAKPPTTLLEAPGARFYRPLWRP